MRNKTQYHIYLGKLFPINKQYCGVNSDKEDFIHMDKTASWADIYSMAKEMAKSSDAQERLKGQIIVYEIEHPIGYRQYKPVSTSTLPYILNIQ
jgi:hypothetical protein